MLDETTHNHIHVPAHRHNTHILNTRVLRMQRKARPSAYLTKLVFVLLGPLVLLSGVFVFFSFWNVLCCKRKNLAERKRVHRSIGKVGERLRSMYLIPFRFYTAAQIFLVAVLLLGTKIVFHVDAGNVTGTLSLVYMLIGYVKTLCGTNTLYAILGACGALLWHAAYNMSAKLIDLSCRATGKR